MNPAFECAVLPHLEEAQRVARCLLHDEQDAQDAVQQAMLRALRYYDEGVMDVRVWLLTIVRRCCFDDRGRRLVIPVTEPDLAGIPDPSPGPEADALASILRERIAAAMESLPVPFREIIELRETRALTYGEISRQTGVSMGTVMSRLSRARLRLRKLLVNEA